MKCVSFPQFWQYLVIWCFLFACLLLLFCRTTDDYIFLIFFYLANLTLIFTVFFGNSDILFSILALEWKDKLEYKKILVNTAQLFNLKNILVLGLKSPQLNMFTCELIAESIFNRGLLSLLVMFQLYPIFQNDM